jgi:hypothetical protein
LDCPAGYENQDGGACEKCANHHDTAGNGDSCAPCGVGTKKGNADGDTCVACPENRTSTPGSGCTKCPAGYENQDGGTCEKCANHHDTAGNADSCAPCEIGFKKNNSDGATCVPCSENHTSDGAGGGCEPCGNYQNDDGFYDLVEHAKACVIEADLNGGYSTDVFSNQEGSSEYFVVGDASMGPVDRVWCYVSGEYVDGERTLTVPVIEEFYDEVDFLVIDATKVNCGGSHGVTDVWDFNVGCNAWDCDYHAHLTVRLEDNPHLEPGVYRGIEEAPLVIIGKRWHAPNAKAVTGIVALRVLYSWGM